MIDEDKGDDRPGRFTDILGGPFATGKAATDACYNIAKSRARYIYSNEISGIEGPQTIVTLFYINHRGQHCYINDCLTFDQMAELEKK